MLDWMMEEKAYLMWDSESGVNVRHYDAFTPDDSKRRREVFCAKIKSEL